MRSALWQKLLLAITLMALSCWFAPAQVTLVSTGAVWKYLDTGANLDPAWREAAFPDDTWASGPAPVGYGDGDEATVVNGGPAGDRFITTYFRHTFTVSDASTVTNLVVRLLRDDGGVVYLNGTEVFRSNMPTGEVLYTTTALAMVPPEAGDESTNFYARVINPVLLSNGPNVLAVEIHQSSPTSANLRFDLELAGNVRPVPPVIAIASPTNRAVFTTTALTLTPATSDPDGVTRVEFFADGAWLGESPEPPFSFVWSNVTRGTHLLTAVAWDGFGLSATSAPVQVTMPALIPSGARWKYLDDGSGPGAAWREPAFDDSGWAEGPAQLGFGEGDEATLLESTNSLGESNVTFYFRHEFEVADPAACSNLVVRLLRDDGGIVYLNGTEVFRNNMPDGPVDAATLASSVAVNGNCFYSTNLAAGLLAAGTNLVAVEIHQVNLTSSDVSFDLELIPNVPPTLPVVGLTRPVDTSIFVAPTNLVFSADAEDYDGLITEVEFYVNGAGVGLDTIMPYSVVASNLAPGNYTLWATATDDSGRLATSAPVQLTIYAPPVLTTLVATGSVWKYLDNGIDQGTNWVAPDFDDSAWPSGRARFGTNAPSLGISTIICIGPSGRWLTTYFRTGFFVESGAPETNLAFRVLRDDGVVAYLNGAEIFRMNMNNGPVGYSTPAASPVGAAITNYFPTNVSAGFLVKGATNVLAVELHQTLGSTDAGFDLELIGVSPAGSVRPRLQISRSDSGLLLNWTATGAVLEEAGTVHGEWTPVTPAAVSPFPVKNPTGGQKFYRLRQP